jgi:thiosulfate/3-mercaptopyruvate sulfurtransferase
MGFKPLAHTTYNECERPASMLIHKRVRFVTQLRWTIYLILFASSVAFLQAMATGADDKKPIDPWSASQVLQPADLAHEIADTKNSAPPIILYVGFRTLFSGGHISGASFRGTASNEQGLADIKKWAATLPRSANLVIYCGCCPFDRCPNIRPAFTALRDLGFTHLHVLALPENFAVDWVEKGYPIQKGL